MPLLRLAVGSAAAVDEACNVAFCTSINDEPRRQLHHVEVGLPCLLCNLHALLTNSISNHFPYRMVTPASVSQETDTLVPVHGQAVSSNEMRSC